MRAKVTNDDLLMEIDQSNENGKPTETLGKMFVWIANYHGNKPQWHYHPLKEEMIAEAIMRMIKSYASFNTSKSQNPFAFLVQVAGCAFAHVSCKEARQRHDEYNEDDY